MTKYPKIGLIFFVIVLSFICTEILLYATSVAYHVSAHPLFSLVMRLIFFAIFTLFIIYRRKDNVVYCSLLVFPFLGLSFNGFSFLAIFSLLLFSLYFREIVVCLRSKKYIFLKPLAIIGLLMIISLLRSNHKIAAVEQLLFFLYLFFYYLVLVAFCETREKIKNLFKVILIVNIFGVLVSVVQTMFGIESIKLFFGDYAPNVGLAEYVKRVPSFFWEAQGAGLYFAIMVFLGCACAVLFFRRSLLIKLVIAFSIVGLLLTGTRIALLAFIMGVFFVFLFNISMRRIIVALFIVVALLSVGAIAYKFVLPIQVKDRITNYELKRSSGERFKIWATSLPIIKHYPLGVGLSRRDLFDAALTNKSYLQTKYFVYPSMRSRMGFESSFLDILYSLGVLGLIIFLWLLVSFFKVGLTTYFEMRDKSVRFFIICLVASMLIWVLSSLTSERCYDVHSMVMFVILLAVLNSIRYGYHQADS